MGSLGVVWGVGITPRTMKGFRLSNSFAVGRDHANLAGRAGLGARIANAGPVEVGPGLLTAGETGRHVEAVALAGGRLGNGPRVEADTRANGRTTSEPAINAAAAMML